MPRSRLFLVGKFRAKLSSYRLEVEAIRGERFVAAQPEAVAPALAGIFDAHEAQVNAAAAALPGLTERAPIVDWPRVLFVLGVVAVIAAWWAGLGYGAWLAGTWPRLKGCAQCEWVFFDRSKNRSGTWCSMTICGNRTKNRAYRRRRSRTVAGPGGRSREPGRREP